jgi:hypothetical protein
VTQTFYNVATENAASSAKFKKGKILSTRGAYNQRTKYCCP